MIVNMPVVRGTYPVTAVGSPLKVATIVSVVSVPVAVAVCAELHVALEIAVVVRACAPLATVTVQVAHVRVRLDERAPPPPNGDIVETVLALGTPPAAESGGYTRCATATDTRSEMKISFLIRMSPVPVLHPVRQES